MNVLFACSGTAGHVNPALAIATELELKKSDVNMLFVGSGRELEKRLIPQAGYELVNIDMSGLRRKPSLAMVKHNIGTACKLLLAGRSAKEIISRFKPDVVVGTGGYICYPVLKKAAGMGIPTFIHDSNAIPGLTTKMVSGVVDKVLVSFPGQENYYKRPNRVIYTGTPVRNDFTAQATNMSDQNDGKSDKKKLIVSFWGSLGAEFMNGMMAEFISRVIEDGEYRHIHAAGNAQALEKIQSDLEKTGFWEKISPTVELKEYIDDMPKILASADIVLCRAGGSTIGELLALKKPSVLIPSPYVSNNEQLENAKQLEKIGGAFLLEEKNCTGAKIYESVVEILKNSERLNEMSAALEKLNVSNAASDIADMILNTLYPE